MSNIRQLRQKRHTRLRNKIGGTAEKPRLAVFRSNKHVSAQMIDDVAGRTLFSVTEKEIPAGGTKTEKARAVGALLADKATRAHISQVVFDRAGYQYHGRIKALAEGARQGGLQF